MAQPKASDSTADLPLTSRPIAWGWVMVGPLVTWFLHLNVMYFLVQPVCLLGGSWTFQVVTVVLLVITVASGLLAWRMRETPGPDSMPSELQRSQRFAGSFGAFGAFLASLAIVSQWYPVFVIGPCQ
jgi:hypothetical protein